MKVGDYLRLGRNAFQVIEAKNQDSKHNKTHLSEERKNRIDEMLFDKDIEELEMEITNIKSGKANTCRIWFEPQLNSDNPLISLCKWIGSVKNVHYEWLLQWIESQR